MHKKPLCWLLTNTHAQLVLLTPDCLAAISSSTLRCRAPESVQNPHVSQNALWRTGPSPVTAFCYSHDKPRIRGTSPFGGRNGRRILGDKLAVITKPFEINSGGQRELRLFRPLCVAVVHRANEHDYQLSNQRPCQVDVAGRRLRTHRPVSPLSHGSSFRRGSAIIWQRMDPYYYVSNLVETGYA